MPGRPYVLSETTWKAVGEEPFTVAVLPWGATEAHNFHLPYGTDTTQVEAIATEAARKAWDSGARCLVLPAIPFGSNAQQVDIPHTINMNASTQAFVLGDIVESLEIQGVEKLLVLNGHGGNDFRQIIRELQAKTDVFLCTLDWFKLPEITQYYPEPGDHAGVAETSLMMHLASEQVLPLSSAGQGIAKEFRIAGLREGWAWAPRNWIQVTADTGVGDPSGATPEGGSALFQAITARVSSFLMELSKAEIGDLYE